MPQDNPVQLVSLIEKNFATFDILKITAEDKAKSAMYLANVAREELKKTVANIDDYYQLFNNSETRHILYEILPKCMYVLYISC